MLANFLKRLLTSEPSEITFLLGFVDATAFELEPLDSLTGPRVPLKDSASVEYTSLISLIFLVLSKVSTISFSAHWINQIRGKVCSRTIVSHSIG